MFSIRSIRTAAGTMAGFALACFIGCAHETGPAVPPGATQVSSGNKVISYTAPHDGKIYLRDDNDNSVVYSAEVRRDQVMKYDPTMQQVMVDGTVATQKVPDSNHDHSWFFERASRPDHGEAAANGAPAGGPNPVPTVHVPVGVQIDVQTQPAEPKPERP